MKAYLSRLVVGSCAWLVPLGLQMEKGQYQLCPQWDNQPKKAAFNSLITLFTMLALVQFVLVGLDVGVNAVLQYLEKYMEKYDVTISMSGITVKCLGQTAPSDFPSGVADGGRTPGAGDEHYEPTCMDMALEVDSMSVEGNQSVPDKGAGVSTHSSLGKV